MSGKSRGSTSRSWRVPAIAILSLIVGSLATNAEAAQKGAKARTHAKPAAAAKAPSIPDDGVLTNVDLLSIVQLELRKPADRFRADPTARYVGRSFRAVFELDQPTKTSDGQWSYDVKAQALTVRTYGLNFYQLLYSEKSMGSYVGTNAYGARTRVDRAFATIVNLEPSDQPGGLWTDHRLTIPADPVRAKALSRTIRYSLEGTLEDQAGAAVDCANEPGNPTISDPYDLESLTCTFRVRIVRIAFVDASNGQTLKAWPEDPAPAGGPSE